MFKFNKNYEDLSQVVKFYPEFKKLYNEIKNSQGRPYNSDFEGKIKGIQGDSEKIAIFLLQHFQTNESRINKIKELNVRGFKEAINGDGIVKFEKIIMVGTDYSKDDTKEIDNGKIIFKDGIPNFILPKGKRNMGWNISKNSQVFTR